MELCSIMIKVFIYLACNIEKIAHNLDFCVMKAEKDQLFSDHSIKHKCVEDCNNINVSDKSVRNH